MTPILALLLGTLIVLVITVATGYFVAQEFAFMAVDRSRLKARAESGDPIAGEASLVPFVSEIIGGEGDLVMTGHSEFLRRAASRLLCGDESAHVIEYKPGHGALFCLEGAGTDWVVAYALRQEHMGG